MNYRIIGKFGFLLSIFGFFMPVACDMNAFQLINHIDSTSSFLVIGLFLIANAGFIIGLLLLIKKSIPVFIDWIIIAYCMVIGIVLLNMNELELQYGAYVIMFGIIIALISQIIPIINILNNILNKINDFTLLNISRAGLIFVIIGFFMPVVFNLNVFQINKYFSLEFINNIVQYIPFFDLGLNTFDLDWASSFLYIIFFLSIIGVILLFITNLLKKNNMGVDSILFVLLVFMVLFLFCEIMIIYTEIAPTLNIISDIDKFLRIAGIKFNILQPGAYFIIFGLFIYILFNAIALFRKENP